MRVLASIEWFSPAYRAGGIISSLKNQIEHLHDKLDFWVVTGNADLTSPAPVSDEMDQWINRKNHHVLYSSQAPDWDQISADVNPDLIYINGLFNGPFNRRLLTWCKGQRSAADCEHAGCRFVRDEGGRRWQVQTAVQSDHLGEEPNARRAGKLEDEREAAQ